jgi:hypothetical protein
MQPLAIVCLRPLKDIFLHPRVKAEVKASSSNWAPVILTHKETFVILNTLPLHQQSMVLLDAVTRLRCSEIAGCPGAALCVEP